MCSCRPPRAPGAPDDQRAPCSPATNQRERDVRPAEPPARRARARREVLELLAPSADAPGLRSHRCARARPLAARRRLWTLAAGSRPPAPVRRAAGRLQVDEQVVNEGGSAPLYLE